MRAPGSFKDPAGSVSLQDDTIRRSCSPRWRPVVEKFIASNLYGELVSSRSILPVNRDPMEEGYIQPRLKYWTYPYEWSFAMLQQAALLVLKVQRQALLNGFTLKDASAYNVAFRGLSPVHVDLYSFEEWKPGILWSGMEQFYREFLNPLLLESFFGIRFQSLYRAELNGISTELMSRLCAFPMSFYPAVFRSVTLKQWSARLEEKTGRIRKAESLVPSSVFLQMQLKNLLSLEKRIRRLRGAEVSPWKNYRQTWSYTPDETDRKRLAVSDFLQSRQGTSLVDYGCHEGEFSRIALEMGHQVIGCDSDAGSIDAMFINLSNEKNATALTLVVNSIANPSSGLGWDYGERSSLSQRLIHTELFMALAICHHLRIVEGIPSEMICRWFHRHHRAGILEYASPMDPMVREMADQRPGIDLSDFLPERFRAVLGQFFTIERESRVSEHRTLLWLNRR